MKQKVNKKYKGFSKHAILVARLAAKATHEAYLEAKKLNIPVYVLIKDSIYEVQGNKKRFIKKIERPKFKVPKRFKLK